MDKENKFKIGEKVWVFRRVVKPATTCSLCGGTGYVHIKENEQLIKCPECDGKGSNLETSWSFRDECYVMEMKLKGRWKKPYYTLLMNNGETIEVKESQVHSIDELCDDCDDVEHLNV